MRTPCATLRNAGREHKAADVVALMPASKQSIAEAERLGIRPRIAPTIAAFSPKASQCNCIQVVASVATVASYRTAYKLI